MISRSTFSSEPNVQPRRLTTVVLYYTTRARGFQIFNVRNDQSDTPCMTSLYEPQTSYLINRNDRTRNLSTCSSKFRKDRFACRQICNILLLVQSKKDCGFTQKLIVI